MLVEVVGVVGVVLDVINFAFRIGSASCFVMFLSVRN